jgi:hypothetical protein
MIAPTALSVRGDVYDKSMIAHLNRQLLWSAAFAIIFHTLGRGQARELVTSQYAGKYSYGTSAEEGRVGSIMVYPETDSTILFYLDVCRGAPSYNLGQLYARLKISDSIGTFSEKYEWESKSCIWTIKFSEKAAVIRTVDRQDGCGFGNAVSPDGVFAKKSSKRPEFFVDGHNRKYFFKETSPEEYPK